MDKTTFAPKPTCFVIQAFDGSKYDRRYHETIKPALVKAGVEPQRADDILGLNPIIEKIERAIESAAICVAEVSEDNPNVRLELGYALALNRPAVILCDKAVRAGAECQREGVAGRTDISYFSRSAIHCRVSE